MSIRNVQLGGSHMHSITSITYESPRHAKAFIVGDVELSSAFILSFVSAVRGERTYRRFAAGCQSRSHHSRCTNSAESASTDIGVTNQPWICFKTVKFLLPKQYLSTNDFEQCGSATKWPDTSEMRRWSTAIMSSYFYLMKFTVVGGLCQWIHLPIWN